MHRNLLFILSLKFPKPLLVIMDNGEDCVLSEVHIGCEPDLVSHISTFSIASTCSSVAVANGADLIEGKEEQEQRLEQERCGIELDENGDMVLTRRGQGWQRRWQQYRGSDCRNQIVIHHRLATGLSRVGLQVWKGALLLAEFLLSSPDFCKGATVIELGAGTGLAGIVAAMAARLVFVTDIGTEVLDNCVRNVTLNAHLFGHRGAGVRVRELDWMEPWPPGSTSVSPYGWTPADIKDAEEASLVIAADVIYSVEMTASFFQLLGNLIPAGSVKVLYLALERRYNFSMRDCDVVAHCYTEFRNFMCDARVPLEEQERRSFVGEQVAVNSIPQTIAEYERGHDLELWKIWRVGR